MTVPVTTKPPCTHCGRNTAARPRGLCWPCYGEPDVRRAYPVSNSKYAHRGPGTTNARPRVPAAPTVAAPGTPEKLAVMAARATRGESLFHPRDPGCTGEAVAHE